MDITVDYEGPYYVSNSAVRQFGWNASDRYLSLKDFNLTKFLRSKNGECWSDVYSELCSKFKTDKERYILKIELWQVEFNATKEGNEFYDEQGYRIWRRFAVVNDILYQVHKQEKHHHWTDEQRRWSHKVKWLNGKVLALINNIWYELILKEYSPQYNRWGQPLRPPYDIFLQTRYIDSPVRKFLYGPDKYCCGKRQLCKKEIKDLGLKNVI